jgi:PAS domain S-box-containing protein
VTALGLASSSELLDLLFDRAAVGLCLVDSGARVLRVNAAWVRATGHRAGDVIGADLFELVPAARALSAAVRGASGSPGARELALPPQPVRGRAGSWEGTLAPVAMADGTGLLLTARAPGAERLGAERGGEAGDQAASATTCGECDQAKRTLHALMEHVPQGITIADAADVRIRWTSRYGRELMKRPREEIEGICARDHVERLDFFRADGVTRPRWEELPLTRATLEGEIVEEEEWMLRQPDGTRVPIVCSAAPIRDEAGSVTGAVCVWRDIADRKLADAMVRKGEDFLRKVVDATPSMVFVKDWEGHFLLANAALASCYGTTIGGLIGRTDADFNSDAEQLTRFRHDDQEVMSTRREKLIAEEPVSRADGRIRWFSTVKVPLVDEDGTCNKVLGVATDVTDRKAAEEALQAANRHKDEFLAMLAHELRNPLAAISSAAHVIRLALARGQSVERPIQILERQVRNSARLLDDLLDVGRITRGALRLHREEIRLDAAIGGAVDSQRAILDAAGHELTVTLPGDPVHVDADPTRLEQILANLLNNAAKYTPPGGHIAVAVEREEGGKVAIRVTDDGMGIPADLLPHVFDLFVQATQALDRSRGGLGLGLALVRKLTEMHGGRVEARSAGPGLGSEFVVHLPEARRSRAAPGEQRLRAPRRSAGRRVLLVEDNFDAAELLAECLQSFGHEVTVVHDGVAALEAAAREPPEVVLLDLGLPGMDGYEVARRLRQGSEGAPVLIAISGYGQDDDRRRSSAAGFSHHLTKPVEPEALDHLLSEAGARLH